MYQNHQQSAKKTFKCKVCNATNQKHVYYSDTISSKVRKVVQQLNIPAGFDTNTGRPIQRLVLQSYLYRQFKLCSVKLDISATVEEIEQNTATVEEIEE